MKENRPPTGHYEKTPCPHDMVNSVEQELIQSGWTRASIQDRSYDVPDDFSGEEFHTVAEISGHLGRVIFLKKGMVTFKYFSEPERYCGVKYYRNSSFSKHTGPTWEPYRPGK